MTLVKSDPLFCWQGFPIFLIVFSQVNICLILKSADRGSLVVSQYPKRFTISIFLLNGSIKQFFNCWIAAFLLAGLPLLFLFWRWHLSMIINIGVIYTINHQTKFERPHKRQRMFIFEGLLRGSTDSYSCHSRRSRTGFPYCRWLAPSCCAALSWSQSCRFQRSRGHIWIISYFTNLFVKNKSFCLWVRPETPDFTHFQHSFSIQAVSKMQLCIHWRVWSTPQCWVFRQHIHGNWFDAFQGNDITVLFLRFICFLVVFLALPTGNCDLLPFIKLPQWRNSLDWYSPYDECNFLPELFFDLFSLFLFISSLFLFRSIISFLFSTLD